MGMERVASFAARTDWGATATMMSGLAVPFVAILSARVFGAGPEVVRTVPWVVITSGPAVFAMAVYVYFEIRVIGHRTDSPIEEDEPDE